MDPIGLCRFLVLNYVHFELSPVAFQDPNWRDVEASRDMASLLLVRSTVLSLLESARGAKFDFFHISYIFVSYYFARQLNSSLGAGVDIILPDVSVEDSFVNILRREGISYPVFRETQLMREIASFLKTLFIVSDVVVTDEMSLGSTSPNWFHSESVSISGDTCILLCFFRG